MPKIENMNRGLYTPDALTDFFNRDARDRAAARDEVLAEQSGKLRALTGGVMHFEYAGGRLRVYPATLMAGGRARIRYHALRGEFRTDAPAVTDGAGGEPVSAAEARRLLKGGEPVGKAARAILEKLIALQALAEETAGLIAPWR